MRGTRARWLRFWVPVLLLLLVAAAAPGSTVALAQTAGPVHGGTLRIGWVPQAQTFDPHLSVQWAERFCLYMVFNTLVGLDKNFNVVP
ncbi:MAG TPA: hypothetical protein VEU07_04395, partial [Candidatus Acidoferrum sp.]|nr:hypothetical protein [Candidatus Acidoferrum sp.]